MSEDTVFDIAIDIPAGGRSVGSGLLQPGQTHTTVFGSDVSFNPASHPYLVLMVDHLQNIDESNETNNTLAIRYSGGKPDLVIIQLTPIEHPIYDIAYRFTIKNVGKIPANLTDVVVQAVMSEDTTFNIDNDIPAGAVRAGHGLLLQGQTHSGTAGATVSYNVATHPYLVLMVDYTQNIDESKEFNNTVAIHYSTAADTQTTPVYFAES